MQQKTDQLSFRLASTDSIEKLILGHRKNIERFIEQKLNTHINNGTVESFINEKVIPEYQLKPIDLDLDNSLFDVIKIEVEINESNRHLFLGQGKEKISRDKVIIYVPFVGNPEILKYRSNQGSQDSQYDVYIKESFLIHETINYHNRVELFSSYVKEYFDLLRFHHASLSKIINDFNSGLIDDVKLLIDKRNNLLNAYSETLRLQIKNSEIAENISKESGSENS